MKAHPLPNGVSEIELAPGYPALQIETEECTATLALHGAHLTHWQPRHTAHPVLYTSPTAIYREGKAIRGGIPLCWPWFNAHPTVPDTHPSHGVARNRFWQLEAAEKVGNNILLSLVPENPDSYQEHVPHEHFVRMTCTLGASLALGLESFNHSSKPQPFGGALHTYLSVSHINKVHLTGLQNTPYLDTTTSPESDTIQTEEQLTITDEVDRIYYGTSNSVTLHDTDWNRQIEVSKRGSLTTVVWNPWQEKAAALGDLPDDAYHDFICIEAANARHDTRILTPGAVHRLDTLITVS